MAPSMRVTLAPCPRARSTLKALLINQHKTKKFNARVLMPQAGLKRDIPRVNTRHSDAQLGRYGSRTAHEHGRTCPGLGVGSRGAIVGASNLSVSSTWSKLIRHDQIVVRNNPHRGFNPSSFYGNHAIVISAPDGGRRIGPIY